MIKNRISVIIPVYNQQEKIIRALNSIKNQSRLDKIKEIIIVDDGSTDNTYLAINKYAKKNTNLPITILRQNNRGAAAARNKGMAYSSGDYISFLDSDDEWLPNKIEIQLSLFEKVPDMMFLGGGETHSELRIGFKRTAKLYKACLRDMLIKSFPVTPSVIFKRKIYLEIGGFDETILRYEDCDYWQRICSSGYGVYFYSYPIIKCDQKAKYGEIGLSENLLGIYKDCKLTLKKRYKEKAISLREYIMFSILDFFKHIRRLIICMLRKLVY